MGGIYIDHLKIIIQMDLKLCVVQMKSVKFLKYFHFESEYNYTLQVGGYNTFGFGTKLTKRFLNLPPHDFISIEMILYFIDNW